MKLIIASFLTILLFISCNNDDDHIDQTIPEIELSQNILVYDSEKLFKGYTLISPVKSKSTYLVNMEGYIVKKWTSEHEGLIAYLSNDGFLYRTYGIINIEFSFGGRQGGIQKFDFDGNLIWDWQLSTSQNSLHHDLSLLPNGNILASVWNKKSGEEAIENGRNPELLTDDEVWQERIIEIKPIGTNDVQIVWEWNVWDHLVQDFNDSKLNFGNVAQNPNLIDINFTLGDANFNHVNSLFYMEEFDQIVFSSRKFSELMIIDHSTTTSEAASHSGGNYNKGGDLLYRWGNPIAYKSGSENDQKLFGQHDTRYLGSLPSLGGGNFMAFNNGRFGDISAVEEINIPIQSDGSYILLAETNNIPLDYSWSYINSEIFSPRVSGAQRLENKNTLITFGTEGILYEIDSISNIVWKYKIPLEINDAFKCFRYDVNFPAFNEEELPILENVIFD